MSLKNRKTRLEFAKKHLKQPEQFWKNIPWTDETQIYLYHNDGRRRAWRKEGTVHDPKYITLSVKHGGGGVNITCFHCGGVQSPNDENCVNFLTDLTVSEMENQQKSFFGA